MKLEELKELSGKQIIGIVGFWNNSTYIRNMFGDSFSRYVTAIEKGSPYNENSPMILNTIPEEKSTLRSTTAIPNGFYELSEGEEEFIIEILKNKLR